MPSNYILTPNGNLVSESELKHYGVKGMKWGVRRYQNPDGTLTAAGKKRAKQEYKTDNREAFELGKNATISGHAAARATQRVAKLTDKLNVRYAKDPEGFDRKTQSLRKKWDAASKTAMELAENYAKNRTKAEEHCKTLIDKYGEEAVKSIRYRDYKIRAKDEDAPKSLKIMNENTISKSDVARSAVATIVGNILLNIGGVPMMVVSTPYTTSEKARIVERARYKQNLTERKRSS